MVYQNDTGHEDWHTPRKLRSGRNSVFGTPTKSRHNRNAESSISHPSNHRNTPLLARSRRSSLLEAPVSSPDPSLRSLLNTNANGSLKHGYDASLPQRSPTAYQRNACHKQLPPLFASVAQMTRRSPQEESQCPSSQSSRTIQAPEPHAVNSPNFANCSDEEDIGGQSENAMNDEEEIHGLSQARATYLGQKLPDFVIRRPGDGLRKGSYV